MIVYVETNFILEMAFLRDECAACQELIALAERKNIRLILPSFCVGEPYEAATRRWKQRREFREKLEAEIRELARSQPYAKVVKDLAAHGCKLLTRFNDGPGYGRSKIAPVTN
jgi:hypothetical protein